MLTERGYPTGDVFIITQQGQDIKAEWYDNYQLKRRFQGLQIYSTNDLYMKQISESQQLGPLWGFKFSSQERYNTYYHMRFVFKQDFSLQNTSKGFWALSYSPRIPFFPDGENLVSEKDLTCSKVF